MDSIKPVLCFFFVPVFYQLKTSLKPDNLFSELPDMVLVTFLLLISLEGIQKYIESRTFNFKTHSINYAFKGTLTLKILK
jgi:hypothetical protein